MKANADRLVTLIIEKCFGGVLPPFPEMILEAVVLATPCVREAGEAEAQLLINALHVAILQRLDMQRLAEQDEFLN